MVDFLNVRCLLRSSRDAASAVVPEIHCGLGSSRQENRPHTDFHTNFHGRPSDAIYALRSTAADPTPSAGLPIRTASIKCILVLDFEQQNVDLSGSQIRSISVGGSCFVRYREPARGRMYVRDTAAYFSLENFVQFSISTQCGSLQHHSVPHFTLSLVPMHHPDDEKRTLLGMTPCCADYCPAITGVSGRLCALRLQAVAVDGYFLVWASARQVDEG